MLLRIQKRSQSKYAYALAKNEARLVQVVGLAGLIATAFLAIGFALFVQQSVFVLLLCLPVFIIVVLYHFISYTLMLLYPGFDVTQHKKLVANYKKSGNTPRVAVFIPVAGEDIDIVTETTTAAKNIRYSNFTVHILDDSRDGMYRNLAKELDVTYFRRRNRGYHKKAGNLNSAIKSLKGYDHILVLDADFVPRKEILEEMVPYSASNVGIVQSPQHFDLTKEVYRRSKFEFGAGLIQREFYRTTQVARARFGGSICVGTNALYNLKAVRKVGGFEGVGNKNLAHAEDVWTGLKMLNETNKAGEQFRIIYVPIQLAKGMCPSDQESFYKQQSRWSTGSMQLLFTRKTLFSTRLSPMQKFCYMANPMYYFYTITMLFTPIQLLILLLAADEPSWKYTLLFAPMLFVTIVLGPFIMRRKPEALPTLLVMLSNAYTYAQSLFLLIIKKPLGWEPSGAIRKKSSHHFFAFKVISSLFFMLAYLATFAVLLLNQRIGINPSTFIIFVFLSAFVGHIVYLHHTLLADVTVKKMHVNRHFYAYMAIVFTTLTVGVTGYTYANDYDVKPSNQTIVAIQKQPLAIAPAQVSAAQEITIKKVPSTEAEGIMKTIVVTATPGQSQSDLATSIARTVQHQRSLNIATAAKFQDKVMQDMGYQDLIAVQDSYSFDKAKIDALLHTSYVYRYESAHWNKYALLINL